MTEETRTPAEIALDAELAANATPQAIAAARQVDEERRARLVQQMQAEQALHIVPRDIYENEMLTHIRNRLRESFGFQEEDFLAVNFEAILDIYRNTCINKSNGRPLTLTKQDLLVSFSRELFADTTQLAFGEYASRIFLMGIAGRMEANPEKQAKIVNRMVIAIDKEIRKAIEHSRQFATMEYEVDMFAEHGSIKLVEGELLRVTYPHKPYVEEPFDMKYIDDYREHWPGFDEMLEMIAAGRVANSRKNAYVWIKATSNWGKGLFCRILEDKKINGVIEFTLKELEKMCGGGPVGKTPGDFRWALCAVFNEAKGVNAEVKRIENKVEFSPKNQPIAKAELYTKLFMSAEEPDSLGSAATGAEDQFINRFSYFDLEGVISDRPLFRERSVYYIESVVNYTCKRLNELFAMYVSMGKQDAGLAGTAFIDQFHAKHGLGNKYQRLSVGMEQHVADFHAWLVETYLDAVRENTRRIRKLSKQEELVLQHCFVNTVKKQTKLYMQSAAFLLDMWLDITFNQSERGKLQYKRSQIVRDFLHPMIVVRFTDVNRLRKVRLVGDLPTDFAARDVNNPQPPDDRWQPGDAQPGDAQAGEDPSPF
jgi:hypothetical protein